MKGTTGTTQSQSALGPSKGAGRRHAFSTSTKQAMIDAAEELFTEHGYAATSLEAIVGRAQVTKGALYHHFSGKQALFETVFKRVEDASAESIRHALEMQNEPWARARAGLVAFLAVVEQDGYRRIVVQDGPAVLGYERFRDYEQRTTFAVVVEMAESVLAAGGWEVDTAMLTTFSRILFGAMSAAGEAVATAADSTVEALRFEAAIGTVLAAFQALEIAGMQVPTPVAPRVTAPK